MHPRFLSLLACPETGEPLTLSIAETNGQGMVMTGTLVSSSGRRFPIVRGIPRFVSHECYTGSFGFEWSRWPRVQFEAENRGRPMQGHTTRMWERITGVDPSAVPGKTIVEFGCGPGRFLDVVRNKGGLAVGVDMSLAVEAARQNFSDDPGVLIVQGDILRPPLRSSSFDGAYSIGVLHHTPDPLAGLEQLVKATVPGGWVSVCVYPKGEFYDYRSVARMRCWHHACHPRFGFGPAVAYSYLAGYLLSPLFRWLRKVPGFRQLLRWTQREWLVWLDIPDARWRVLDVFDAITPTTASTHTAEEVAEWLSRAGCSAIRQTSWCSTSYSATADKQPAIRAA